MKKKTKKHSDPRSVHSLRGQVLLFLPTTTTTTKKEPHSKMPLSSQLAYKQSERKKVKVAQSCLTLYDPMDYSLWNSPGQNTGVGSLSLLQGISPTQGSNPGLPHCRQIFLPAEPQGKPINSLQFLY